MTAIYKREMRAYFSSPIGYIFVALFMAVSAWFFMSYTLQQGQSSDFGTYFQMIIVLFVAILPLLTMKLMSEERKLKTEQLILTGPVTLGGIVVSKFLAAFSVFGGAFLLSSGAKGKRFALPNAEVMIHQPSTGIGRIKAEDLKVEYEQMEKCKSTLYQILSENTNRPIEEIAELCKLDKWYTADEAVNFGLIDSVIRKKGK